MAEILRLGIIGMSDGNGHPYSWSAIFNGYDSDVMASCPFPVIPEYLAKQTFPQDSLGHIGKVTHIWTQDKQISRHIAEATKIKHVVDNMEEMIGSIDAILLARDDAEKHYEMALPFINAGLPIYIDKPLALALHDANKMFSAQVYEGQIFTCSSLRFAKELRLSPDERMSLGAIHHIEGSIMKKWDTYSVHLLEPFIAQFPERGNLKQVKRIFKNDVRSVLVEWENISGLFKTTGDHPTKAEFRFYGLNGNISKYFFDSFNCFKSSLEYFINIIQGHRPEISRKEVLEIVEIIERGRRL